MNLYIALQFLAEYQRGGKIALARLLMPLVLYPAVEAIFLIFTLTSWEHASGLTLDQDFLTGAPTSEGNH